MGAFWNHLFPWIFCQKTLDSRTLGRISEGLALKFLIANGFKILARNWRPAHGHGEIDIITFHYGVLVFVEVRARNEGALVRGALSLNAHKKQVLRHTIEAYLRVWRTKNPSRATPSWRFDVVEVTLPQKGKMTVAHFPGTSL